MNSGSTRAPPRLVGVEIEVKLNVSTSTTDRKAADARLSGEIARTFRRIVIRDRITRAKSAITRERSLLVPC